MRPCDIESELWNMVIQCRENGKYNSEKICYPIPDLTNRITGLICSKELADTQVISADLGSVVSVI